MIVASAIKISSLLCPQPTRTQSGATTEAGDVGTDERSEGGTYISLLS